MRITHLFLSAATWLFLCSCSGTANGKAASEQEAAPAVSPREGEPAPNRTINPLELVNDFQAWYGYTYTNIRLAQEFFPMGPDSALLTKAAFLKEMLTGNFIPVKRKAKEGRPVYQLVRSKAITADIRSTVQQMAQSEIEHLEWEGKTLPSYRFTDLDGRAYTPAATSGKLVMLKCWFISCVACVAEFPELNRLVESYQARKDVLFLSLATDAREDLVDFLKKKPFRYAVVPEQENYLSARLRISAYPTHILVGRNGRIIKMTNALEDILPFLEKEAAGTGAGDRRETGK